MSQPFIRERFSGEGRRAHRGPAGKPTCACAPVRACRGHAVHDEPAADERSGSRDLRKVEAAVRLSRYGGTAPCYCMLAAGHIDLVIGPSSTPADVIPLIPIIKARRHRDHLGHTNRPKPADASSAAGDTRVHAAAFELFVCISRKAPAAGHRAGQRATELLMEQTVPRQALAAFDAFVPGKHCSDFEWKIRLSARIMSAAGFPGYANAKSSSAAAVDALVAGRDDASAGFGRFVVQVVTMPPAPVMIG